MTNVQQNEAAAAVTSKLLQGGMKAEGEKGGGRSGERGLRLHQRTTTTTSIYDSGDLKLDVYTMPFVGVGSCNGGLVSVVYGFNSC